MIDRLKIGLFVPDTDFETGYLVISGYQISGLQKATHCRFNSRKVNLDGYLGLQIQIPDILLDK